MPNDEAAQTAEKYAMRTGGRDDAALGQAYIQAHPEFLDEYKQQHATFRPEATADQPASLADTTGLPSPYTKAQQAESAGGSITGLDPEFAKAHPAIAKIHERLPLAAMGLGIAQVVKGGLGARAAGMAAESGAATEVAPATSAILDSSGQPMSAAPKPAATAPEASAMPAAELGLTPTDPNIGHIMGIKGTGTTTGPSQTMYFTDPHEAQMNYVRADEQPGVKAVMQTSMKDGRIAVTIWGEPPESAAQAALPAPEASAGTPAPAAATPESPYATPESAVQTLADKQVEALKAARIGKLQAERMGLPKEAAVEVPSAETIAKGKAMGLTMDQIVAQGSEDQAAKTAAIQDTFATEARDMGKVAREVFVNPPAGFGDVAGPPGPDALENIPPEIQQLANRFSTFVETSPQTIARPSEIGRELQILGPTKPDTLVIANTAKIAQQLHAGSNPWQVAELLARFDEKQTANAAVQMQRNLRNGSGLWRGIVGYYQHNLLSNPMTLSRVAGGNAVTAIMSIPERAVAARIPQMLGMENTVEVGEAMAAVRGFIDGLPEINRTAIASFKTNSRVMDAMGSTQFIENPMEVSVSGNTMMGRIADKLAAVWNLPPRGLTADHQWFQAARFIMNKHMGAYRRAVGDVAQRGLSGEAAAKAIDAAKLDYLKTMPTDLFDEAMQGSRVDTFQQKLGKVGTAVKTIIDHVPGLNLVVPFLKVSWNMESHGLDYLPPLNLVKNARTYFAGPSEGRDIAMARLALGAGMAAVVASKTGDGWFTGSGPNNRESREAMRKNGWRPNSFWLPGSGTAVKALKGLVDSMGGDPAAGIALGKALEEHGIEGGYVPNDFLGPLGIAVSTVANTAELMGEMHPHTAAQAAGVLGLALGRGVASPSWLLGLGRVLNIIEGRDQKEMGPEVEQFLGQTASGFVPFSQALKASARAMDPDMREINGWVDGLKDMTPGWSRTLPAKHDMFDDVVAGRAGVVPNLLFPIDVTHPTNDPVRKLIADLEMDSNTIPRPKTVMGGPSMGFMDQYGAGKKRETDFGIDLTPQQTARWNTLRAGGAGLSLYDAIDAYRQSPQFELTDKEGHRKEVARLATVHGAYADKMLRLEEPQLMADYLNLQINRKLAGLPNDLATPSDAPDETASSAPEVR